MKVSAKITSLKTVNSLKNYWTTEDYLYLLNEFNYPDAEKINPNEVLDFLLMAITDFEPAEAAAVLMTYKLNKKLSKGQIQNISHEMLVDKVAEEYSDPSLHYDLFNINQLLHKAFNGTFPNTEATIIQLTLALHDPHPPVVDKEVLIKTLASVLKANNLIHRLFAEQLEGSEEFGDLAKVIWTFSELEKNRFEIITSKYWIEKDDFMQLDFDAEIGLVL